MDPEEDRLVEESWSKKEREIKLKNQVEQTQAVQEEMIHPTRRPLHQFFILISIVTGIAACNMGLGQLLGIVFQTVGPIQYVLRLYVLLLCLLVIFNELEWTAFTRDSKILRFWITRGLIYAFIGVLGLEENDTSTTRNADRQGFSVSLQYLQAVAWIMISCGALYTTMGLCCLQLIETRLRNDYQRRRELAQTARHVGDNVI